MESEGSQLRKSKFIVEIDRAKEEPDDCRRKATYTFDSRQEANQFVDRLKADHGMKIIIRRKR